MERTTTYDPVAYAAKWDSPTVFVVSVLQSLKYISSKSVASSSKRQDLLEATLTSVTAN